MMRRFLNGFAFAAALFASGCVSLLPETAPPKPRYHMEAGDALEGAAIDWSLVVEEPRATRSFDTVKVAVSTMPGKIEYYDGAEWADRTTRLFHAALVQSFENSGRILEVGDRYALPVGDFVLQTDIRRLQLDVDNGARAADVAIFARLSDGKGKIYAARVIEAREEAARETPDEIMLALSSAMSRVLTGIVDWTYETGEGLGTK